MRDEPIPPLLLLLLRLLFFTARTSSPPSRHGTRGDRVRRDARRAAVAGDDDRFFFFPLFLLPPCFRASLHTSPRPAPPHSGNTRRDARRARFAALSLPPRFTDDMARTHRAHAPSTYEVNVHACTQSTRPRASTCPPTLLARSLARSFLRPSVRPSARPPVLPPSVVSAPFLLRSRTPAACTTRTGSRSRTHAAGTVTCSSGLPLSSSTHGVT